MSDIISSLEAEGKKFTTREMPLWISMLIFVFIIAAATSVFFYFKIFGRQYTLELAGLNTKPTVLEYGPLSALENSDYFAKVKEQFIEQKANFIEADLSSMILRVHKDGQIVKEVPIMTKGREGSWWETPAGIYKIETKESNHFSSFGKVYQPWSMAFQGNFFIHGWPYHPDGSEVESTYSGGCIRLSTANAKEVYDIVTVGMPVLVYEKDFFQDSFKYTNEPAGITAERYLVADLGSDSVLYAKDPTATTSIASITKLMTSLVAAEYINLDNIVTINENMLASTSKPRLKAGQKISVYDPLLKRQVLYQLS